MMVLALLAMPGAQAFAQKYPGLGRAATPAEIQAWDIDVRPDFAGLPPGSGSVAHGQKIWESKCAGCHGTFGESNEMFPPIVGGTMAQDVKTGRVEALSRPDTGRTMTPFPPTAITGNVRASSPARTVIRSPHRCAISEAC